MISIAKLLARNRQVSHFGGAHATEVIVAVVAAQACVEL
jgi:hypothetical protein